MQRNLGRWGEDVAHRYLRRKQYTVVARNYRPASGAKGEIDLIARYGAKLIFVEVKTRAGNAVSFPERAVDESKQRMLVRTARDYARRAGIPWDEVRFDVIAITGLRNPAIEHLQDAFGAEVTID